MPTKVKSRNNHLDSVKAPSMGEFSDTDAIFFWIFWGFIVSCISACCFGLCSRGTRSRPRRRHVSHLATQREEAVHEEEVLERRIHAMESQLTARRLQRQVQTARLIEETAAVEMSEAADERGRAVYGDAWDNPVTKFYLLWKLFS